jgi:hypothetical protein
MFNKVKMNVVKFHIRMKIGGGGEKTFLFVLSIKQKAMKITKASRE